MPTSESTRGPMVRKLGVILGICIAVIIAIALFGAMFARPYSEETLVKKGVIEPDSRFIDVEGVRTRYVEEGEGEKAIVFIHGFSSSLYTWRSCLGPIAKRYRVVALDLKGFGFSGKPETEYTTDGYADFVIQFMDAVGLKAATLCGNSMGGNIAWRTALKYPDRVEKLILVDASGYPSQHRGMPFFLKLGSLPGVGEILSFSITRGRIRSSLESAYHDTSRVTERTVDVYYYSMRTEGAMHAVLARLRSSRAEAEKWKDRISELDLPTLIVWGDSDTWVEPVNAERFHSDIAGSELVIIAECGHLPQEEKPEEFAISVLEFMLGRKQGMLVTDALPNVERALSAPEVAA